MKYLKTAFLALLLYPFLSFTAHAQDEETAPADTSYWSTNGTFNTTITQIGLSNWQGGGEPSIAVAGLFNVEANYRRARDRWRNRLTAGFGIIRQGEQQDFRKSDDEINLVSNYTRNINQKWGFSSILNFRSIMAPGYRYFQDDDGVEQREEIGNFMAPAYLTLSAGFSYTEENFSITASPIAGRSTFVLDESLSNAGAYGVDPGERFRQEVGVNLNIDVDYDIRENISLKSWAIFFADYQALTKVKVDWRLQLTIAATKYLSTNITTHLIYDEDINITRSDGSVGPATQFKHVIGLGMNFKF